VIDLMFEMNAEARTTLVLVTHDDAIARPLRAQDPARRRPHRRRGLAR